MDAPLCQRKDRHRTTSKDYSSIVINFTVNECFPFFGYQTHYCPSSRRGVQRYLGLFVCMSVRARYPKTVAKIDLIVLHKTYYTRGSVFL